MNHAESFTYLQQAAATLPPKMYAACQSVLRDQAFLVSPASVTKHHIKDGGLVVHTAEVLEIALGIDRATPTDRDVLVVAAVFHDYAKIHDYKKVGDAWVETSYRRMVRHVAGSFAAFHAEAVRVGLSAATTESVGHAILAHHGRKKWGSPVEPITKEAYVLHYADMLSARFAVDSVEQR